MRELYQRNKWIRRKKVRELYRRKKVRELLPEKEMGSEKERDRASPEK